MKPQFVNKLPDMVPAPGPGPIEAVDEIPTQTEYYDGSLKLNVIKVNCRLHLTVDNCVQDSHCGWCGSSRGCVSGNNIGPFEPCVKSSYIFSNPIPNWNTQTRAINEHVGGVALTILNKHPA